MEAQNLANDSYDLRSLQQDADVIKEQMVKSDLDDAVEKKKIKHSSALAAAAACRSAVQHAHLHIISSRSGDFAHTATNISYDI